MPKIPDDRDAQEELFYSATGKVIREWAELEILLGWYLTQLLQVDQFRSRVVWHNTPTLRGRVQLLRKLANTYVDDPVLPKVEAIFERIEKLGGKRNILAHCLGGVHDGKRVEFVRDEADDDVGMDFIGVRTFHLSNIVNWADDIVRLRADMDAVLRLVRNATHPSPKMHRVQPAGQSTPSARNRASQSRSVSTSSAPLPQPVSSQGLLRFALDWGPFLTRKAG